MVSSVRTDKQVLDSYVIVECTDLLEAENAKFIRKRMGLPRMTVNSNHHLYLVTWPKATRRSKVFAFVCGHPSDQPRWDESLIKLFRQENRGRLGQILEDGLNKSQEKTLKDKIQNKRRILIRGLP